MPTTNDTSTRVDVYIWARSATTAAGLIRLPRNQVPRYATPEAALAAKGDGNDGFPGESLFRIIVKEIAA